VRHLLALLLLATVASPVSAQAVVVVRHAEKASETERDPVLSPAGEARAAALDSAVSGLRFSAIIVTPFQRTRQTAAVVARRNGLTPIEVPVGSGGVAAHALAVAAEVARHTGNVLVVGHSNTVGEIVAALGGSRDIGDLCDSEYQSLFIVLRNAPDATVRARFGAPNPVHLPACGSMKAP
jgi:phosphohistidine phosphatase SixA